MPWIETIDAASATGDLRAAYDRIAGARGGVAQVHQIQSLNPGALIAHFELYRHRSRRAASARAKAAPGAETMTHVFRIAALGTLSGFLTRPCCVVPAVLSLAGAGTAGLSSALVAHRGTFLSASALLLASSTWVNFRRDGGWFNKSVALGASLVGFALAAGWVL